MGSRKYKTIGQRVLIRVERFGLFVRRDYSRTWQQQQAEIHNIITAHIVYSRASSCFDRNLPGNEHPKLNERELSSSTEN